MSIRVLKPGMFTTVQDLGRHGYQEFGMPVAGAMDELALRLANRLVGNPEGEAALEMTLLGPRLELLQDAALAVTGADLEAAVDGELLPLWESVWLPKGSVLAFGRPRSGVRAYVAFAGGIDVPQVMGSKSTYVRGRLSGFQGRTLQPDDVIPLGESPTPNVRRRLAPHRVPQPSNTARVVLGPQDDHFTPESVDLFLGSTYRVSPVSDRMGYRLDGPTLKHRAGADIISDAIPPGAVQVPGHGTPIVMLADRQTTGGYPKIATVISADLRVLAQLAPGDSLSFRAVSVEEAVAALRQQERLLDAIEEIDATPSDAGRIEGLEVGVAAPAVDEATGLLRMLAETSLSEVVWERPGRRLEVRR